MLPVESIGGIGSSCPIMTREHTLSLHLPSGWLSSLSSLLLDYWEIRIPPSRIYAGIFIFILLFGLSWEIAEYYIDLLVKSSYNNGLADSIP